MTNADRKLNFWILWNLLGSAGKEALKYETDDDYVVAAWENWLNMAHELECGTP